MAAPRKPVDQSGRPLGRRALETRQRLLDATEALLAQRSLRELRVVEIARSVGTSPATFYQYFRDVEEAILRLVERAAEEMPAILELIDGPWQGPKGLDTARAVTDAFVRHWDAHAAVLRLRNLKAEEGDKGFRRARLAVLSPVVERLAKRVEEFQKAGRTAPELSPWAAASSLIAMLERMSSYHQSFERAGVTRDQLVETCARILHQTVTGRAAA
jgi:AcrR family transcriptional regulator